MNGWIAVSRDIFENPVFANEPKSEREAWIWMTARAVWKDTHHRVGAKMKDVPRGSFFCTLRELQDRFGWKSDKRVRGLPFAAPCSNVRKVQAATRTQFNSNRSIRRRSWWLASV